MEKPAPEDLNGVQPHRSWQRLFMTKLGSLLKTWRSQRSISLSGLALKAGIGKATLSRWEAGRTLPRIAELEAVLGALNVSGALRHEALVCLDAPRALHRLQELEEGLPLRGDLIRAMQCAGAKRKPMLPPA